MKGARFINNTDRTSDHKTGAAIGFLGMELKMNDSVMQGNNGLLGGCVYIEQFFYKTQILLISYSIFSLTWGQYGGVFGSSANVRSLTIKAENNSFINNFADSNFL